MAKKLLGKRKKLILIAVMLFLAFSISETPDILAFNDYPTILGAHRGSSVEYIENTMPAFESAIQNPKYQFIEIDVQYTKDNQIIVLHDTSLLRMQGKNLWIEDLTYEELLNASDYDVPLFEEVMDLIGFKKKVNIEIKSQGNISRDKELVDEIIEDLKERKVMDQVLLSSIPSEVVKYITESYPKLKKGKIYWTNRATYLPFEFIVKDFYEEMNQLGADYIMLHGSNLNNYKLLTELKPDDVTLVFWYFNDQMYIMQKDAHDKLWIS
jgi:glycerophosphoryl diester phosphodiesterase